MLFVNFRNILCGFIAFSLANFGQLLAQSEKEEWKVDDPHGPFREVSFTTNEGTWMNLDVSPDGKELVFDLLGDIYTLPIKGGKAKLIAGGMPYEVQPRYSPDGKWISYTSDRDGGDNIWIMDRAGKDARKVTKEDFRLLNNAVWTPDNQYLIARKHFTSTRSLGAGELWMYHTTGGEGLQLTKRKNDQQDAGEPCVSPDGRYVYFSEDVSAGPSFQYNKDPNKQIYVIKRFDRETGAIKSIVTGAGGAVRPQVSPNGKLLAFVRRVRTQTVLYLHDLETGEEWPLYNGLSKDQQETWAIFGVYPNYAWLPDGKHIVIWAQGVIVKLSIKNLSAINIPFTVEVKQKIADALHFRQEVLPDEFEAKMLRNPVLSPDGKKLVFNSVGYLWIKELPFGKPQRLTSGTDFEFQAAFSPDGQNVAFTTWNDSLKGSIALLKLGSNKYKKLTQVPGFYHEPSFSPDGQKIVLRKGSGNYIQGYTFGKNTGLYWLSVDDGVLNFIREHGSKPSFDQSGQRIFFMSSRDGKKVLQSITLANADLKTHFQSKYAKEMVISPDNKWVVFTELFQAYIAPFAQTGKAVDLHAKSKAYPVYQLTRDAGNYLHWSQNSQTVHWMIGSQYFSRNVKDCFSFVEGASENVAKPDSTGIPIELYLKSDIPKGTVVFKDARIITMEGDLIIEKGTIIIENNRIIDVGNSADVAIPKNAAVVNCANKTIMPGLVDVHAHLGTSWNGISPQQQWSYYASLAYGVTTTHDPSANTEMVFSQSEMVKAGHMVGPRIFSTGTILYGAEGDFKAIINNIDDARSHLRRLKAVGAFSVKSYNQPRRDQRQQVIKAARELGMMVYPEGGSFFFHNMSMILDGHTGIEHSIPVAPLHNDVIQLWSKSKTGYTPTLIVGYGGVWGENYWYQKTKVWEEERLLRFTPRAIIDARSRRRMIIPDDDFGHVKNSRSCKKLLDAGAKIQLGAHGQLHGLGAHWELWMLRQGGMSNLEAMRAATQYGADYIGMGDQIGSIKIGKLADLIVLDKNPLEDLRNSESVVFTMVNGRLYNAKVMQEVGNYHSSRHRFFWEHGKSSAAFPWHEETNSFTHPHCGCFTLH